MLIYVSIYSEDRYRVDRGPRDAIEAVTNVTFVTLVVRGFTISLRLNIKSRCVDNVFTFGVTRDFRVRAMVVNLSNFGDNSFIFVDTTRRVYKGHANFTIRLPPLTVMYVLRTFKALTNGGKLITILRTSDNIVSLRRVGGFRNNQHRNRCVTRPGNFTIVICVSLVKYRNSFFAISVRLYILVGTMTLFRTRIKGLRVCTVNMALSNFGFHGRLTIMALIPMITKNGTVTATIVNIPPLVIRVGGQVRNAIWRMQFVTFGGISADVGIGFLCDLAKTRLYSVSGRTNFSVVRRRSPHGKQRAYSIRYSVFFIYRVAIRNVTIFHLGFRKVFMSSTLFGNTRSGVTIQVTTFVKVPVTGLIRNIVNIFLRLLPTLMKGVVFILVNTYLLNQHP